MFHSSGTLCVHRLIRSDQIAKSAFREYYVFDNLWCPLDDLCETISKPWSMINKYKVLERVDKSKLILIKRHDLWTFTQVVNAENLHAYIFCSNYMLLVHYSPSWKCCTTGNKPEEMVFITGSITNASLAFKWNRRGSALAFRYCKLWIFAML